jgi:hypothetical protein
MHLIMSYHLLCIHDTYVVHMHAIGVPEGVTLLEYEQEQPEEQQAARSRSCRQRKEEPTKKISLSVQITSPYLS